MNTPLAIGAEPVEFTRAQRLIRGAFAFAATALWALSFHVSSLLPVWVASWATAVGVAAGGAWILFGAVLASRSRASGVPLVAWIDACLATMSVGCRFLLAGAVVNVLSRFLMIAFYLAIMAVGALRLPAGWLFGSLVLILAGVQVHLLIAAAVAMSRTFLGRADAIGMSRGEALCIWWLGLQAPFGVILAALRIGAWLS